MAGTKDFKLAFGVDISELASGLANAQAAVTEAAAGMKEALAGINAERDALNNQGTKGNAAPGAGAVIAKA